MSVCERCKNQVNEKEAKECGECGKRVCSNCLDEYTGLCFDCDKEVTQNPGKFSKEEQEIDSICGHCGALLHEDAIMDAYSDGYIKCPKCREMLSPEEIAYDDGE